MGGSKQPKTRQLKSEKRAKFWRVKTKTYEDILGVIALDSTDDSGSNHELLPGLGEVKVVHTILSASVHVSLHLLSYVLGANVNLKPNSVNINSGKFDATTMTN